MADGYTPAWGRRTFLRTTGAVGALAAFGGLTAADPRDPGPKDNELLVGISAGTGLQAAQVRINDATPSGTRISHRNDDLGYLAVRVGGESNVSAESPTAEQLRRIPGVKYVEENAIHHAMTTPDDPLFDEQYAPQQVRAPEAWNTTTGSEDVTIAVVDQGVKYDHPDLESRFGSTNGEDFVDDDGDPYPDSMDDEYHGTHVAGIASGTIDNGTGVAGVSESTLLSARALDDDGKGSTSDIADAVQWATDQGADVINMSLGGGGYTQTMKNAVSYALDNGALPICAAGNDGERSVSYPAAYDECLGVSAVDADEELADFSNYGEGIDLAAPGVEILSCWTGQHYSYGPYKKMSGTSMACPVVSGIAALGLAAHPEWSATKLRSTLTESAVDLGLSDLEQGAGRVDAANLVGTSDGNSAPSAAFTTSPSSPDVGETVTVDASSSSDSDGSIERYEWTFGDGTTAAGESASHAFDSAGTYTVTLTVSDDAGGSDSVSKTIGVGTSNESPSASFTTSPSTSAIDETVSFDASGSTDSDGSIERYEWDFGDGTTGTGRTVTHSFESTGDYTVSLTVTDDAGATDTVAKSITVRTGGGDGQCGDETKTTTTEGSLGGYWDSIEYTYTPQLSDLCQVSISMSGPSDADFDLYVTTDGRTPSTYDFDKRSLTQGSQERVVLDDVESGQTLGILVDSYSGSGQFRTTTEELGN